MDLKDLCGRLLQSAGFPPMLHSEAKNQEEEKSRNDRLLTTRQVEHGAKT
jgi:hypothetical protein